MRSRQPGFGLAIRADSTGPSCRRCVVAVRPAASEKGEPLATRGRKDGDLLVEAAQLPGRQNRMSISRLIAVTATAALFATPALAAGPPSDPGAGSKPAGTPV